MKNRHFFLKLSILLAFSYWCFDSVMHYFVYGEFHFEIIPKDFDELWMRCIIFILLISFGLFADYHTKKLIEKNTEKHEVYRTMLNATHHILNNFLNKMTLFRVEAEKSKDFNKDMLKLYNQVINDTDIQIRSLENIQEPSKINIEKIYKPK